jgi:hypothetical protein
LSEIAEKEGVSINQLISSAVAEKMSALLTEDYLAARASRGKRSNFLAALAKVPDVEPDSNDRLAARPAKKGRPSKMSPRDAPAPRLARSGGRR